MKNVITGTACLLLLSAVLLQFIHVQTIIYDMHNVMDAAETFRENVRLEGCVTENNERQLKKAAASCTRVKAAEIQVKGMRRPVRRGGKVHYVISVPLGNFVLAPAFFHIKDDTGIVYREERWAASEYLNAESEKGGRTG